MRTTLLAVAALLLVCLLAAAIWLYTPDKPRAVLEAEYARPPSTFLTVAGIRLHLRDTGPRTAPALVLLHGFGSSLQTWDDWAASLSTDYRVIRLDLPGFGLTGADPTGIYTDARTIAVLLALLDRLGIPQATFIGNSMGGRVAWSFAAAHPGRVAKLVLISPDGFASPGIDYGKKQDVPLLVRVLPYTLPMSMLRANLAAAYADPAKMTRAALARTRDMMLAPGVRSAIIARMEQSVLTDPRPALAGITAPTLLLWGEKDALIPIANARDYLAALPNARLVALPDIGHVPQEEAPAESLVPLRAFLANQPAPKQ
jgi:pimeloyl-ACP methyl ester carboxylesterase